MPVGEERPALSRGVRAPGRRAGEAGRDVALPVPDRPGDEAAHPGDAAHRAHRGCPPPAHHVNPAQWVELAPGKRPKAVLWADQHVEQWQRTGEPPSGAMVWTPAQIGRFLDEAESSRLCAPYRLIAFRGLRHGEAAGGTTG